MLSIWQKTLSVNVTDQHSSDHPFKNFDQMGGQCYRPVVFGSNSVDTLMDGADQDKQQLSWDQPTVQR